MLSFGIKNVFLWHQKHLTFGEFGRNCIFLNIKFYCHITGLAWKPPCCLYVSLSFFFSFAFISLSLSIFSFPNVCFYCLSLAVSSRCFDFSDCSFSWFVSGWSEDPFPSAVLSVIPGEKRQNVLLKCSRLVAHTFFSAALYA